MTDIPREFPLPEDAFERQRALLSAHVARERQSTRPTRRRVVAVAAVVLIGGVIVAPGFGLGSRVLDLLQGGPPGPDTGVGAWSPDGGAITYLRAKKGDFRGAIYVVSADGRRLRKLSPDTAHDRGGQWSPDGRRILVVRQGRRDDLSPLDIWVMNADGSGQRNLTPAPGTEVLGGPDWSPDGQTIAFGSDDGDIYVMNADGSGQRRLTRGTAGDSVPIWSPDGRTIAFTRALPARNGKGGRRAPEIHVMNADGSGQRKLSRNAGYDYGAAWSPDGQKIAFVRGPGKPEIHVMNADGSGQKRLTRKDAADFFPVWSPDGRRIAFLSERDGNGEIYIMNADGSGQRNLTRNAAYDTGLTWSPNGKIGFISNRGGKFEVYAMNADGSGVQRLTRRRS